MRTRILTALCLAPPFLWCVWFGGWPLGLLCGALGAVALGELHAATKTAPPAPVERAAAFFAAAAGAAGPGALLGAFALASARLALPLAFPPVCAERVRRGATGLAALALYVLPFGLYQVMRAGPAGGPLAAALLALVWAQDSGAYFSGRAFGGAKLSPQISPKKTWAGAVGGFLIGVPVAAGVFVRCGGTWAEAGLPYEPMGWGLLGAAAAAAQLGDLVESGIKRAGGVKDSGTLFPGHGGVLDRFDAFALAVLVAGGALLVARSC